MCPTGEPGGIEAAKRPVRGAGVALSCVYAVLVPNNIPSRYVTVAAP